MIKNQSPYPSIIKELLIGFCLGTANIIPGVSGGTFLLIFKIYDRVFFSLNHINKTSTVQIIKYITALIFFTKKVQTVKELGDFLRKNDFLFLLKLMAGAGVAIILLSSLMKYLIVYQFSVTYAFFFGLILISIIIPVKMLTDKKIHLILFVMAGAVATIYVAVAVNPYEKVKLKSDTYESQYLDHKADTRGKTDIRTVSFTGRYTPDEYLYAMVCGAIAVSAMVLPGISGSLVLILMGEYFEVVSAISGLSTLNLDSIAFLGCFAIGIIFGGILFARVFTFILHRYYNTTMAFLIGLMTGSLYALWPFKKSVVMAVQYIKKDGIISIAENVRIYTNINELPQPGPQLYLSLISFVLGCIIMFFFVGKEVQK